MRFDGGFVMSGKGKKGPAVAAAAAAAAITAAGLAQWEDQLAIKSVLDAAWAEKWAVVEAALACGFPIHSPYLGNHGTLLHAAAYHGFAPMVRECLRRGLKATDLNHLDQSPILYAARHGSAEALGLLLPFVRDINARDRLQMCPLMGIVVEGKGPDVAERLRMVLDQADLDLGATYINLTAEEWARKKGKLELADMLAAEVRWVTGRDGWWL